MADEGASPTELIIEACRRDNTDLLQEVISSTKPTSTSQTEDEAIANLLNNARDALGNAALHVAASSGSSDVLDLLLDQPGLETDPLDRLNGETPLHKAVAYCNGQPLSPSAGNGSDRSDDRQNLLNQNHGHVIVDLLLDAGCDPRIRNKGKMKAVDLVDPRNTGLRDFLRRAEVVLDAGVGGDDVVEESDEADNDPNGGSESD